MVLVQLADGFDAGGAGCVFAGCVFAGCVFADVAEGFFEPEAEFSFAIAI